MIAIAEKIIEQQEGPFDPSQFVDRYEKALKELIEEKKKGHKPAVVAEPENTNVIDLMAALKASLGGKVEGCRESFGESTWCESAGQTEGAESRLIRPCRRLRDTLWRASTTAAVAA